MKKAKSRLLVKLIAILLIVSLCAPISAQGATPEATTPRASDYLMEYSAYICAMGDGDLEIWFEVTGTDYWADIGVLTIYLYESTDQQNWTRVDTFHYVDYPGMLDHDNFFCMSHVDYDGIPGRYYKAYVCIWAGPEDGGDARYIWTPVERCT